MARNSTDDEQLADMSERFDALLARKRAGGVLMSWEEQWLSDVSLLSMRIEVRNEENRSLRAAARETLKWIDGMRVVPGGVRARLRTLLARALGDRDAQ